MRSPPRPVCDEPVIGQVGEIDRSLPHQRMVDGQRRVEWLPADQPGPQRRRVHRQPDEGDVQATALELLDAVAGHHPSGQRQRDVREPLTDRPGQRRQRGVVEGPGEPDGDRAEDDAVRRPGRLPAELQLLEHTMGVRQETRARPG